MTKAETLTLKVDPSLLEALKGVPNRSRFVRDAILAALERVCPVCSGTGVLTPHRKRHWDQFAETHVLAECPDCHEVHLTCKHDD